MLTQVKEQEYPLLGRKTVWFSYHGKGATPSRLQLRKEIAHILHVKEEDLALENIHTSFGSQDCQILAHIYSDEKKKAYFHPLKEKDAKKLIKKEETPAGVEA